MAAPSPAGITAKPVGAYANPDGVTVMVEAIPAPTLLLPVTRKVIGEPSVSELMVALYEVGVTVVIVLKVWKVDPPSREYSTKYEVIGLPPPFACPKVTVAVASPAVAAKFATALGTPTGVALCVVVLVLLPPAVYA